MGRGGIGWDGMVWDATGWYRMGSWDAHLGGLRSKPSYSSALHAHPAGAVKAGVVEAGGGADAVCISVIGEGGVWARGLRVGIAFVISPHASSMRNSFSTRTCATVSVEVTTPRELGAVTNRLPCCLKTQWVPHHRHATL